MLVISSMFLFYSTFSNAYTDAFKYWFECINDSTSYYSLPSHEALSSETTFDDDYQICDEVCLHVYDIDGDATNESDNLSNMVLKRYSGDLDSADGSFSTLSNYGAPDGSGYCAEEYHWTWYCWGVKWTDNYLMVYWNTSTDEVRKTEVSFTDDHSDTHVVTVVPTVTNSICIE